MPIPDRTSVDDYHYHVYDYKDAEPWKPTNAHVDRSHMQFYSMRADMIALAQAARDNEVPNLQFGYAGIRINADSTEFKTLALHFGSNNLDDPKIVLTGGIHAREWIAAEMTYLTAEYLIKHYSKKPANEYAQQISDLVNSRHIVIVPMLNPAGNSYSIKSSDTGARYWRKNRRELPKNAEAWIAALDHTTFRNVRADTKVATNVLYDVPEFNRNRWYTVTINSAQAMWGADCNRNSNTPNWGHETVDQYDRPLKQGDPTQPAYFGPGRASEDEVRNLQSLLNGAGVAASIDYHCFGELIIIPTESAVSVQHRRLGQSLQTLIQRNGSAPYTFGTPLQTVKYHALSSIMDYMALAHSSRAFTIEADPPIPTNVDPSMFQQPENTIMGVFEKNIRGVLSLIATAGSDPVNLWGGTSASSVGTPWASTVTQFLGWNVTNRGNQLPT
jgi:hypothetical protein